MVLYKCEKCNKEFSQKSNYIAHINRKNPCDLNERRNIIYKCEKCNKEFTQRSNYMSHINKKNSCNNINIVEEKIENYENSIKLLNDEIRDLKNIIIFLEKDNEKINELYNNLLDKCIKSNTIITNNTTNNTINVALTSFGLEDYNKLTKEEQIQILKSSKQSIINLIKYLHINDRLPEYKNICIKNLRGKGGYLYEGNKWFHCNYENLLLILFKNKINDLDKLLEENKENDDLNIDTIRNLIDNYTDDMDSFIKNNKDNIINMLYNNTKDYKIN